MKIAPSILNSNFLELKKEINKINNADYIHLDVMDGNFVPNISFGPLICEQVSKESKIPLDIHLMVNDPTKWISNFSFFNTEFITVHYESSNYLKAIEMIKKKGIKVGLSIRPKTNIKSIEHLLSSIDLILVMSVEPGFGGQSFIVETVGKVNYLHTIRKQYNYNFLIEVDGGINNETITTIKNADICVVGSYLFKQNSPKDTILLLQKTNM